MRQSWALTRRVATIKITLLVGMNVTQTRQVGVEKNAKKNLANRRGFLSKLVALSLHVLVVTNV